MISHLCFLPTNGIIMYNKLSLHNIVQSEHIVGSQNRRTMVSIIYFFLIKFFFF